MTQKNDESAIARPTLPADLPAASSEPGPVSIGVACLSCAAHNSPSARVCGACGAETGAGASDAAADDAPRQLPRVALDGEPDASKGPVSGAFASHGSLRAGTDSPAPPARRSEPGDGPWAEGPELMCISSRTRSLLDLAPSTPDSSTATSDSRSTIAVARAPLIPNGRDSGPGSYEALPAAPIADPLIGVVVADRYRIVELLGRGGMGIVYKVQHTSIGKLLAMKLLTGELSRNPEVVRRFKQEALTVSKLSSPNTVQVFDFGQSDGLTYLVMELVAGDDLGRVLRASGPMPFVRLGKICVQVCSSLAEAHAKGIVHRDVKPENIMLMKSEGGAEIAKVLDFGLAKLRESSDLNELTSHGAIVGTPYFMSPEQVRGEGVDARSDVYSLGAVMYRALTGHYAFNGPTPIAVFTKHLTEAPIPLIERAPERGISLGVSDLVLRALEKDPARRWQSVEDLQAALLAEIRSAGVSSADQLLESAAVKRLAKVALHVANEASAVAGGAGHVAVATRDEIEAYERKLRRQRHSALAFFSALAVVAAAVGFGFLQQRPVVFTGLESEPNNRASEANALPLGRTISGALGKRLDAVSSDIDFYSIDVPAAGPDAGTFEAEGGGRTASVRVTALPNFGACTMLFRAGLQSALYQFCVGRPGRDLVIPALRLEPGRYFLAVKQDLDRYGATAQPFVYENVSDTYSVTVALTDAAPDFELEPNDQLASANFIAPRATRSGVLGWARDEDVFCAAPGSPAVVRWSVRDVTRDAGSVVEATPMRGATEGVPVRVHPGGKGASSASDALSPWVSGDLREGDDGPRCLRIRLVNDPWTSQGASAALFGGSERYAVSLEIVP